MVSALKIDRRQMVLRSACAVGSFSLVGFFPRSRSLADVELATTGVRAKPRAKAVINLFLSGGPSQMDTFDYKPQLEKYDGKPLPFNTPVMANPIENKIFPSPFKFAQHG